MAALALNTAPLDGGRVLDDVTVAATGGGDTAACGPGRFLYVKNGGGSSVTVTAVTPGEVRGLPISDATLVLAAGKSGLIALPRDLAGTDGRASITYSGVTSVTVAAVQLEA